MNSISNGRPSSAGQWNSNIAFIHYAFTLYMLHMYAYTLHIIHYTLYIMYYTLYMLHMYTYTYTLSICGIRHMFCYYCCPWQCMTRLLKGAYLSSFHGICQLVHMCNNGLKVIIMMPICHYDWKLRLHTTYSTKSMLDIVQW